MRIPALLLLAVLAALPPSASAKTPPVVLPPGSPLGPAGALALGPKTPQGFDDPEHGAFFRYQLFLRQHGLAGLDAKAWAALSDAERAQQLASGEKDLAEKYASLLMVGNARSAPDAKSSFVPVSYISPFQEEMLKAVWGTEVASGLQAVQHAAELRDQEQYKKSLEKLQALTGKVRGPSVDWDKVFDNALGRVELRPADVTDYAEEPKSDFFLDKVESADVKRIVSRRDYYQSFLENRGVPEAARPPLMALYDTIGKAKGDDAKQLEHILPTVVQFLRDGKSIEIKPLGGGALGMAVPDEYDRPMQVLIDPSVAAIDPLIPASILGHEFQHVYDMYTGRYYTLDSELRGFKTNVLLLKTLKESAPKKYESLVHAQDPAVRDNIQWLEEARESYERSPQDFGEHIAFIHGYCQWFSGAVVAREPLRDVVQDTNMGPSRQLATFAEEARRLKPKLAAAERALQSAQNTLAGAPTQGNQRAVESAQEDVTSLTTRIADYQKRVTVMNLRLARMKQEAAWASKKSGPDEPYDLNLSVDRSYAQP